MSGGPMTIRSESMNPLPASICSMRIDRAIQLLLLAAGLAASAGALAGPAVKPIALVSTPAAVQQVILERVGSGRLEEIDPTDENGEKSFEVTFTSPDHATRSFTVADDGTILSLEMPPAEMSEAARKTIRAEVPGGTVEEVDKNLTGSRITYDVEVTQNGRERSLSLDADGKLISREVTLAEVAAVVQSAITNEAAGGQVENIDENVDPEGNNYDVTVVKTTGLKKGFTVASDGSLLSRDVRWDGLLPAVRRTIQLQLAGGKVIRVDRWLKETVNGVHPYEVTGRKNGAPYDFFVGPYGRFLGMAE